MSAAHDRLENDGPVGRIGSDLLEKHAAHRRRMPETRQSLTHKFSVAGQEGYLTVGLDTSGIPGELFLKMSKEGSTMSGWAQAFCLAFSLLLQHGMPLEQAVVRFKGMRFEPFGMTTNDDIPEASSIIDYIARYLELEFPSCADASVR